MVPASLAAKSVWIQSVWRPASDASATIKPIAAPISRGPAGATSCRLAGVSPPCSTLSIGRTPKLSIRAAVRLVSCPSILATASRRRQRVAGIPANIGTINVHVLFYKTPVRERESSIERFYKRFRRLQERQRDAAYAEESLDRVSGFRLIDPNP